MAVDEYLLRWARRSGGLAWRLYQWTPATLSLGYFQQNADRTRHPASCACPVVRRASGGGAIVHDKELTYSIAAGEDHALARRRHMLYREVHLSLLSALAALAVDASLVEAGGLLGCDSGTSDPAPAVRSPDTGSSFLCFERRYPCDIVTPMLRGVTERVAPPEAPHGPWKIAGSAQRRAGTAVLQHGSILLARSSAAPELPGVAELSHTTVTADALAEIWLPIVAETFGIDFESSRLDDDELRQVREIELIYRDDAWTEKRRKWQSG